MGLFSLTQELAIDLGTANTLIIYNGKVVVDEPSIVALDVHTGRLIAVGAEAQRMQGKENPNIRTIRPLKNGVIADFKATELMLRGLIKKVKTSGSLFSPSLRMVICIPSGSTNVEIRAVRDSAEHAGGREVYMIYEPMAAALGAGMDVEAPEGHMVIDIGGGTSEIACISLGGIVCSESINVAGDVFTTDIQDYVRKQHSIRIGERTAERIKQAIGAALSDLEEEPEDYVVTAPNLLTALPQTVSPIHIRTPTPPQVKSPTRRGLIIAALVRSVAYRVVSALSVQTLCQSPPAHAQIRLPIESKVVQST